MEPPVAYIFIGLIAVILVAVSLGGWHVHSETIPGQRPSMAAARRVVRQSRLMASGDLCECGGVLAPNGQVSERFGDLLGCSDCPRRWTADGRRVIRVTRPRHPRPVA
jgi:hypothetical protein